LPLHSPKWVLLMIKISQPFFENKNYGPGGGIPVLKNIWDMFDFSLLFSQAGIRKHAGVPAWIMTFAYICGLIGKVDSTNQNAVYSTDAPALKQMLQGKPITQSAFSRFLSKPFRWLDFAVKRIYALQEKSDTSLTDGDIIALDDTKIEHPYGKKIPFLCWLFDSSDKRHVWCMNLVTTLAVLKNGLEYPLLWRIWVKTENQDQKQTKLELAKKMLSQVRKTTNARLWVAMDRWYLSKKFLDWLLEHDFDWVTKAKRNTVLYRRIENPWSRKKYAKVSPAELLKEVYPKIKTTGKNGFVSIPEIYIKLPYTVYNKKGESVNTYRYVPIAAVAGSIDKSACSNEKQEVLPEDDEAAKFQNAYLLISNRWDKPDTVAQTYLKRWKIEVFYRFAKQKLGLTSCYARNESAHFAHIELLFLAQTLLCYAEWVLNKEGAEFAPTHCDMVKSFFNAGCRIYCDNQQIQFYFDTTMALFASLFQNLWPTFIDLRLWNWGYYPLTA